MQIGLFMDMSCMNNECRETLRIVMSIYINSTVSLPESELEFVAIRAQGKGGQNVNKVSSAIQLRFDICRSSLPEHCKQRLLALSDQRLNKDGVIVIKSQEWRTQEKNREAAIVRLVEMISAALVVNKRRIATKPSRTARAKRVDEKVQRSKIKAGRGRVDW